jgi:hypothetical protein
VAINKSKKALNIRGVIARKQEKACKVTIQTLEAKREAIPNDLRIPICNLEKDPTADKQEALKPHLSLIQALEALQPIQPNILIGPIILEDVEIILASIEEQIDLVANKDNSDKDLGLTDLIDSSNLKSNVSIDSIKRNADFVSFI